MWGGGVGGVGTNVPDGGQIFFGPGDRSGESSTRLVRVRVDYGAGELWPRVIAANSGLHRPIIAQSYAARASLKCTLSFNTPENTQKTRREPRALWCIAPEFSGLVRPT